MTDNPVGGVPDVVDPGPAKMAELLGCEPSQAPFVQAMMPMIGHLVHIAQLATGGDVGKVAELVARPQDFYKNLFKDHRSDLIGMMHAKSLGIYLTQESRKDPLEHGKLAVELHKLMKEEAQGDVGLLFH